MFAAYELGLDGLAPNQIEGATKEALRVCKFFPAPAELRELVPKTPIVPDWKQKARLPAGDKGIIESDSAMLAAYKKAMRILDDGGTMSDVKAMLLVEFPPYSQPVTMRADLEPNVDDEFESWGEAKEW